MAKSDAQSGPGRLDLELTRLIDAPRSLVWEAWTRAEHLTQWFCPAGWTVIACDCDFRKRGRFDICMRSPDGQDHWQRCRYTEIVRPERIVFTNAVAIGDGEPLYEGEALITFTAEDGRTRLDVRHAFILRDPSAAWMVEAARPGWEDGLDKLDTLVATLKEDAG